MKYITLKISITTILLLLSSIGMIRANATPIDSLTKESSKNNAEYYNDLGTQYRRQSLYNEAICAYKKVLSTNDEVLEIKALNNLGVCYRRQDKLRSAASYHLQALKFIENFDGKYELISFQKRKSLNSIGNIYLTLKQYDKALDYFHQALTLEIEAENHLGLAINYNNMGICYHYQSKYIIAEKNYRLSLKENQIIESSLGLSISYNSLGELYLIKNQTLKAMEVLDSALAYSNQLRDNYHRSITHINLSKAYTELALYPEAFEQLNILDSLAEITNSRSVYYALCNNLSTYYEQKEIPDSALLYYRLAVNYNDSIVNEGNSNYINDILSVYGSEKKEQEIALLKARNKIISQRQKLGIAVIIVLTLALSFFYFLFSLRKKRQILELETIQQRLLRSQMNPHFLFNALGSIQNYMLTNNTKKAASYLNNFASLTRSILEHSAVESVILDDEIEALHNYIKLEQMRLQHSFKYSIVYDNNLESEFIHIPPMLIQPFVENAIKHGLKTKDADGELTITIVDKEDILEVQISDNGKGFDTSSKQCTSHKSMAMNIFNQRISLLKKEHRKIADQTIKSSQAEGTQVVINIPIFD